MPVCIMHDPTPIAQCAEGENDDLNLYAFKEWEGMFTGYFLPRWEAFFKDLNASMQSGKPFDRAPFAAASCEWEQKWSHATTPTFRTEPVGDAVGTAKRLVKKWRPELLRGEALN